MYEQERRSGAHGALPTWQAFTASLAEVREQGLSRTEGSVVAGVSAMSAPVFDHRGQIVLAITAIGTAPSFDTRWDGALAQALRQSGAAVSERLGWRAGG